MGSIHYSFLWIFRAKEITSVQLAWSNVSVVDRYTPTALRISLEKSKTDQLQNGLDMHAGRTDSPLCPVGAGLDYMAACGSNQGTFFRFSNGHPLTKSKFTQEI